MVMGFIESELRRHGQSLQFLKGDEQERLRGLSLGTLLVLANAADGLGVLRRFQGLTSSDAVLDAEVFSEAIEAAEALGV